MDLSENAVGKIGNDMSQSIRKSVLSDWIKHVEQGNRNGLDASKLSDWKSELKQINQVENRQ
jgi:hypothetical protein